MCIIPITAEVSDGETWYGRLTVSHMYKIELQHGKMKWVVHRRFTDFFRAYAQVKQNEVLADFRFPSRTFWLCRLNRRVVQIRKRAFNRFVKILVGNENLCRHPAVQQLLQLHTTCKCLLGDPSEAYSTTPCEYSVNNDASEENNNFVSSFSSDHMDDLNRDVSGAMSMKGCHARPTEFDFQRVIGRGSFGKVFLAYHFTEKKKYAIKVLNKRMIVSQRGVQHIHSERNALLQTFDHPFLISLKYSFQTDSRLYFVMEYISGGELFAYLQNEHYFDERRAKFYIAEAGCALGFLHSKGIIYRDLKPENMLLDGDGHLVLTDFGLCKMGVVGQVRTNTYCGTPDYLAPEIILKQPYGKSVDWWCLGCVLFEMLHGLPPFYDFTPVTTYTAIVSRQPRSRRYISYFASSVISGLLQKLPERRLGSGQEDFAEIQQHPFFKEINWYQLERRQTKPPFVPSENPAMKTSEELFQRRNSEGTMTNYTSSTAHSQEEINRMFEGFAYHPCCGVYG